MTSEILQKNTPEEVNQLYCEVMLILSKCNTEQEFLQEMIRKFPDKCHRESEHLCCVLWMGKADLLSYFPFKGD